MVSSMLGWNGECLGLGSLAGFVSQPRTVNLLLMSLRVLESLKAGRRLPEARFGNLKVASKGQPSVYGAFSTREAS